jgi:hypothetical protein
LPGISAFYAFHELRKIHMLRMGHPTIPLPPPQRQ